MNKDISTEHGVDLLLGGHDHVYWISKGVSAWDDYDLETPQPDAKDDQGDVLIVKSGTDFQDLSDVTINLKDAPAASGCVRKKVIHEISGGNNILPLIILNAPQVNALLQEAPLKSTVI